MLSEQDLKQIEEKGITREQFLEQINQFKQGFPPVHLDRPATSGDGIMQLNDAGLESLTKFFDEAAKEYKMLKFVPASGAATRMFKDLFAWRDLLKAGVDIDELINSDSQAATFFGRMRDNAFWDDLKVIMDKDDLDAEHLLNNQDFLPLLEYLLFEPGLDYAALPKALIAFHKYDKRTRTAMEEHLVEGTLHVADHNKKTRIHFTLSPEHINSFKEKLISIKNHYENKYSVEYEISWSVQKPSTDTIAVGMDNLPFRERDGSLLFRPGGHGALIENLQDLDTYDLIFIKNIDNIIPDRLRKETVIYKKVLGAVLMQLQQQVFKWLHRLEQGGLTAEEYASAVDFASDHLQIDRKIFTNDLGLAEREKRLQQMLNRPIRVCGMVKNEGEPGGGPFWVKDKSGFKSLQIVEMSQINMKSPEQANLVKNASHFNPVDLVCSIKDYKGKVFDLNRFIDHDTGFISMKSKDGKELKALERPGLWNGAMANWTTIFVEVPLITFNPVKTINDLLRPEHQ